MPTEQGRSIDIELDSGAVLRVQPVAPHTFRIRLSSDRDFGEPPLVRYGIVRQEWPAVPFEVEETATHTTIAADQAALIVDRSDGLLTFRGPDGRDLLRATEPLRCDPAIGFRAEFALPKEERLYGLGDESREQIEKRGHLAKMWVRNVASYVPLPILLSSGGWGLFLNTTWRHYFDLGRSRPDRLALGGRRGNLDFYLIAGPDLPALLDRYTDIAGKPCLLPLWGYGLTFVCNQQADAREMLDDCLNFRREEIPCDLVGLEPGWMETRYDYSIEKKWHPERFYLPYWSDKGDHTFLGAADRLGFKMSLWLCCDYDLSLEEERRAGGQVEKQEVTTGFHPDDFEQDENFGHGPVRMDRLTDPKEPWFAHLQKFVDQGVSAFKMDGALQVNEHPDRKWGNGMDDEEMHNLYPTLLNKQMSIGFSEQTGRRAMIYSSGGYAGIQRYAATWAGDTGGGPKPLISILNHGLSGHSNASCDMNVFTAAGIHFGFFMPWSQVCSWAYWRHPWLLGDELGALFKFYARLRYRLLPYIYSMAHVAARTGLPLVRAMPLAFPDDPRSDELMHQYMFGDAFLTGAFVDEIHLPAGRWIDYWTGQVHDGPLDLPAAFPADRGGPLFLRAGAILPHWPLMQYVGQKSTATLNLHLYPHGESRFTLYEDDGISHEYLNGAVAATDIRGAETAGQVTLGIDPRQGAYPGMPEERAFEVWLHAASAPAAVEVDGGAVEWRYDTAHSAVRLRVAENRSHSVEVRCAWE